MTAYRLYMNYRWYQITLQCNIFTKIGAVRSSDWIFITGALAWLWLGEYVTLDKKFCSFLCKQEVVHIFFLIAFPEEAFIRNTVILLCVNYVIIICINHNNAIINTWHWTESFQSSFQTGSGTGASYCHIFSLSRSSKTVLKYNLINKLWNNYKMH